MISGADIRGLTPVTGQMTYLYGLSDFWTTVFQDQELVDSLLEISTQQLGDAYSGFLQRAGNLSIQTVAESINSEIKLILISDGDSLDPIGGTSYRLSEPLKSVRYIINRPLLPTVSLESGVHYEIREGGTEIFFYKPLEQLGFPRRVTKDGVHQFALWGTDAYIDENIVYRQFGSAVGMTPERSIGNYRDFVEGLFYLYSHGPIIDYTVAGVNLALGIPTARATEKVLSVMQDPMTGFWRILTSKYYYEIPYGFFPDIAVGDELVAGQQLTSWVEIRDYVKDKQWWYNTYIPKELTGGVLLDPVTPNSDTDYLMQNYLRFNTFMVLFKQAGITLDGYYTVSEVIFRARPSHTYPVFVWSAPMGDELVNIKDDELVIGMGVDLQEPIWEHAIIDFVRDDTQTYFTRGTSTYTRCQIPVYHQQMIGDFPKAGELRGGGVSGVGGWVEEAGEFVEQDARRAMGPMGSRGRTAVSRGRSTGIRSLRGEKMEFHNGFDEKYQDQNGKWHSLNNLNQTPLYMAHRDEILEKLSKVGVTIPLDRTTWIDRVPIKAHYDDLMVRKAGDRPDPQDGMEKVFTFRYTDQYIPAILSRHCGMMYIPEIDDLPDIGSLILTHVHQDFWSVSLVVDQYGFHPTYMPVDDGRPIEMSLNFTKDQALTRETYLANAAVTDLRNRGQGQYNDGRGGKDLKLDRSGVYGGELRAFIRRD